VQDARQVEQHALRARAQPVQLLPVHVYLEQNAIKADALAQRKSMLKTQLIQGTSDRQCCEALSRPRTHIPIA
jgi:hypothetical protein